MADKIDLSTGRDGGGGREATCTTTTTKTAEQKHMVCEVPAAYSAHIDAVAEWFERAATLSGEHGEIEAKVGRYDPETKTFDSVVDAEWFVGKLQQCMAPDAAFERSEEETTTSVAFESRVRAIKKADGTATFVRKLRKSHLDFRFEGCALNARLSHNLELPCEAPCEATTWVRLRRRKSFYYKNWRYDFSWIFEGETYQQAKAQPVKYEIEIECIDPTPPPGLDYRYMATTFLMKVQDMCTPAGTDAAIDAHKLTLLRRKERAN